ncbi:MAG: hypothetical protein GF409_00325 [Candidatus Omnitrophica bacterium]|nr:hypothetical protein [Candidatus Omnitrophota bacterium]
MNGSSGKPWISGAVIGLIGALLVFLAGLSGIAGKIGMGSVVKFLGAVPLLLTEQVLPDPSRAVSVAVFCVYWSGAGAVIGHFSAKGLWGRLITVFFLIALFYAHYKAYGVAICAVESLLSGLKDFFGRIKTA